jgi:hypothetical protein
MTKAIGVALLALLTGCAAMTTEQYSKSPCAISEVSYECQVERYNSVNY